MKKKYSFKLFFALLFGLFSSTVSAADSVQEFPLDGVNLFSNADEVTYSSETQTITYAYPEGENHWQYAGWTWAEQGGVDLSAYSSITIHFTPTIATSGQLEFTIKYVNDPVEKKFSTNNQSTNSIQIILDGELKNAVEYVYLKSEWAGSIVLGGVTVTKDGELDLAFASPFNTWKGNGCNYDSGMNAILFPGGGNNWMPWAWGNSGANFAGYDYFILEFEEYDQNVWIEVTYNPENVAPKGVKGEIARPGATFAAIPLNPEYCGSAENAEGALVGGVRDIMIKADGDTEGYLFLKRAYVAKGVMPLQPEAPPVDEPDLIVTDITWDPQNPKYGDNVKFSARVKNIGTKATKDNTKHGLTFSINDGGVVAWSDDHFASIASGEEAVLTACGPNDGSWFYGLEDVYIVKALVNDDANVPESDLNNNTFSRLIEPLTGIDHVSLQGKVYAENNELHITGYSPDALVIVYDLTGQTVTGNKSISDRIHLESGAYMIKIQYNGKSAMQKVLVK